MQDELPYLELRGGHREVGRQLGEAAREIIARELAYYIEGFPAMAGMSFAEAVERARAYLPPSEATVPGLVAEVRGMAEGASVPFEHLWAANCNEEFTCLPDQPDGPSGHRDAAGHCTTFAFVAGDRVVAGHNEDWYPGDIENLVVRHVTLDEGTAYLAVGSAGTTSNTAVTSHGLCGGANTVYSWDMGVGVPNNLVLAGLHQCRDLESLRERIATTPRARGSNHLPCDDRGRIWDIETTATKLAWIDGGRCFVHTNHYVSPELAPQDATTSEGTFKRRARAEELLGAGLDAGGDPVALAQSVLRDDTDAPLSICAHWDDDDPDPGQSVTTVSMVWEPAERRVHVAVGQPCEHEFVTYGL
jgi:isopenicillin-N N-acyltransferase-like protein